MITFAVLTGFGLLLVPALLEATYAQQMWAFVAGIGCLVAALVILETRRN
jgi:hypothetical protein